MVLMQILYQLSKGTLNYNYTNLYLCRISNLVTYFNLKIAFFISAKNILVKLRFLTYPSIHSKVLSLYSLSYKKVLEC